MKVDKLFAVLVLGGGVMAGCGGQPAQVRSDESPAVETAGPADAPVEGAGAASEGEGDGESGKCAWY